MYDLAGQRIATVSYRYALEIVTDAGWLLRAETTFGLLGPQGVLPVPTPTQDQPEAESLPPALAALQGALIVGTREDDGRLVVDLGERSIIVEPDEDYEAWELVGPHGERVICLPGGELSEYS